MNPYQTLIEKAKLGFKELPFSNNSKEMALDHLKLWLEGNMFGIYIPHIVYLIDMEKWDLLLDSFYRLVPFGTGGRRGLVGVGPNRINACTVKTSAQRYSQYLINRFGDLACQKGVILAYDVRECIIDGTDGMKSINTISSFQLAESAAMVYAASGIKVSIFNSIRSTPLLSFAVRYLKAVGGCVFSASHNLPQYNGEKFYNYRGSQFVPPYDEEIFCKTPGHIDKIEEMSLEDAFENGFIEFIGGDIDQAYYDAAGSVSLSDERNIKILYSPLHGTGLTSVFPVLRQLGFDIYLDSQTSNLSSHFENVPLKMPNPELKQSFDNLVENAGLCDADIVMNTDPDADRLGLMVHHKGSWTFMSGNQIGVILTNYVLRNMNINKFTKNNIPLVIKTVVTTSLIEQIAYRNGANCIGDLLVGFKYICDVLCDLDKFGFEDNFVLGLEESNGFLVSSYCREKDASGAAVCISELAAALKRNKLTLVDYMNSIYSTYGYCHNSLSEIQLHGAGWVGQIERIMKYFRTENVICLGNYQVETKLDRWEGEPQPHMSTTDTASRNMITFVMENSEITQSIKLTVRPSGTEPKLKIYIEVFGLPFDISEIENIKATLVDVGKIIERDFLIRCYDIMGQGCQVEGK